MLSRAFLLVLVVIGYKADSWIWWVWAALLLFVLRHPVICDESDLGPARVRLGWAALLILILSFTPVPVREIEHGTRGDSHVTRLAPQKSGYSRSAPRLA
jgi:hypothetical protein